MARKMTTTTTLMALAVAFLATTTSTTAAAAAATATVPFSSNATSLVTELNADTFLKVYESETTWAVAFYNSTEKASKQFADDYEGFATRVRGIVEVGAVDAAQNTTLRWLLDALKITKFPSVLNFPSRIASGKDPLPTPYKGPLTADALTKWSLKQVPYRWVIGVKQVSDLSVAKDSKMPVLLLLHNLTEVPPAYRSLSLKFADRVVFCESRVKAAKGKPAAVMDEFKVKASELPVLLGFKDSKLEESVRFKGNVTDLGAFPALSEFVEPLALSLEKREEVRKKRREEAEEADKLRREREEKARQEREAKAEQARAEKRRKRREERKRKQEWEQQFVDEEERYRQLDGELVLIRDEWTGSTE